MNKRIIILIALTAIGLRAMNGVSLAATSTHNLNVASSVISACNITSVTDISFGVYDTTSTSALYANGNMTFRCTKNTEYKAYVTGLRSMTGSGGDTLFFDLWADGGYSVPFPIDNSGGWTPAPSNAPISKTIYGRIIAGLDVGVDSYSRLLVATVEY